jgi:hypothetical protein
MTLEKQSIPCKKCGSDEARFTCEKCRDNFCVSHLKIISTCGNLCYDCCENWIPDWKNY